jgi:hypothetical protein
MIMSCRHFVIALLALLMGAAGAEAAPSRVKVVNGRDAPASVMDQTVLRPVHGNTDVRLQAGQMRATLELITPPEGKMVVIRYVTIRAFVSEQTANALLVLSGDLGEGHEVEHFLDAFPPPISLNVVSTFQQLLTQRVLLYSTGPVRLDIDRGQISGQVGDFDVSFSGYLVKAP